MENPHEVQILQEYRRCMEKLQGLWDEIGFDSSNRNTRVSHITDQVKNLLSDMVEKETSLKKKIHSDVEKYGHQFYNLNKELCAGIADPDDDLSLMELEQFLRQNVDYLVKEARKRSVHLKELQTQEQELCERLVEDPTDVPKKSVPSKEDIEDLERKIRTLEQEKVNREKTFHYLQSRILKLMEELEQKPNCSFQRDILSDVELFTLSQQNLQKMKENADEFELKVKQNERECKNLREQIILFYNRLEIDQQERDNFLSTVNGHSPSVLIKLLEEHQRLKQRQQQEMGKFINKLRREIEDWWERCYIGEEERNEFTAYSSDEYTEEVLQSLDEEVQRLCVYYNDNKALFAKIEQRKEIWVRFMDLEERANDPVRLFGNRGCSLLQEEKERKRVKKALPIIESELESLVEVWEAQHGKPFYILGRTVSQYIENDWLEYHERKEQERKKKQSDRKNQLDYESKMGSRPPSVKRRIANLDMQRKSKLQRIGEDHSVCVSANRNPHTSRAVLRERNPNFTRDRAEQSADVSTYSHFAEGIQRRSERETMRSSAVNTVNKTPVTVYRPSPHRPPPGLPKTPKTLPRLASRCSPRLSASRSARRSSRNMTSSRIGFSPASQGKSRNVTSSRLAFSPGSSPLFRSPRGGLTQVGTPNKWNKRPFLI